MQVETQASIDLKALVVEMIRLSLFMLLRERLCYLGCALQKGKSYGLRQKELRWGTHSASFALMGFFLVT